MANGDFLIDQYDKVNHELTWLTLERDLLAWKRSLEALFDAANATISEEADGD